MEWEFEGEVIEWRGPSPYFFVLIPPDESDDVREAGRDLVYWGQVPVQARIGETEFRSATFPYGEQYVLPLRVAIRRAEQIEVGDVVQVGLRLRSR
ncbi:hypothetical protein GCM10011584_18970 [Nocardioides phosphati]|uniref:DUF1905 domain-containing protein n=1 Tax=Nocardioides phosphati TaxID=1867775 RepID=A0ABQ2NB15_9ACTN|nr:DUF1905 domain-containing protein [Nocardioides phosphati]GGO89485.1 hypothetical protein GCM10011584_18970 [Nocardioides phosphati]